MPRAQVPLAPPEDILSWLKRIGLLEEEKVEEEEEALSRGDSLLDDEFDLDDEEAVQAMDGQSMADMS